MDMKEIKSIDLVSYTLMNPSVNAVWAFIYAIFSLLMASLGLLLAPSTMSWSLIGVYVAMIVVSPVSTFMIGIAQSFLTALIYNLLMPRIGGIKLGLVDLSEIKNIPVVPFALMTSTIGAIMTFLIALIIVPLFAAYLGIFIEAMSTMAASTGAASIPTTGLGAFGAIGAIIIIIIAPIVVFILSFIIEAILAGLYNLLAPKIGGIKLEFSLKDGLYEILAIPPVQVALIIAAITAIIGFIVGLIVLIISAIYGSALVGVLLLLAFTIGGFIIAFIVDAILALIYNFLRPKIGGVKLELE